ncbi:signal peptide-containing protein [Theileria equi strain WA]|uniref:Signal peptide-containing protein n=1 Tax=Theileria equi strain WA TaxID=1537102 RepID=L0AWN5_THEEQ|nr:signal peptide-containing protein [Theileria equi strain WA]AFZ80002.1 signal peptide-containing protein [Theileria equi strain WA]|eukprot:XP_004829668.1 signal peptide-containing protein [Theileria equi strain WA]
MNVLLRVPLLLTILLSTKSALGDYGNLHSETEEIRSIIVIDNNFEDVEDVEDDLQKTPITLDISREVPAMVTTIKFTRAFYYEIDQDYHEDYKIGIVKDDGQVIAEDSDRLVERIVYFCREDDGRRVVRINDYYLTTDGEITLKANELVKEPGSHYVPLVRYPVDVDILSDDIPEEIERSYGVLKVRFIIRSKMENRAFIGVVKYGGLLVDAKINDDIIEKVVTLNTTLHHPEIKINLYQKDGSMTTEKYFYVQDENGKRIVQSIDEVY